MDATQLFVFLVLIGCIHGGAQHYGMKHYPNSTTVQRCLKAINSLKTR